MPSVAERTAAAQSKEIRKPKHLPLSSLSDNTLWILLFCRGEPRHNNFHWAFYLHRDSSSGGLKYHAKTLGSNHGWIAENYHTAGITKEFLLVGLFRLADAEPCKQNEIVQIIQEEDDNLNDLEGFTCRMYVKRACERLKSKQILDFSSWEALQEETSAFGNKYNEEAEMNVQPRPFAVSDVCSADRPRAP